MAQPSERSDVPKRIPLPCSAENCGDNYPVCGKTSTYSHRKCRCDACTQAMSEYQRNRYRDNENARKYYREKYAANRDAALQQARDYRNANREKVAEKGRRYYGANRKKRLEWQRQYSAENREKIAERARQRYEANRERQRELRRRYAAENLEAQLQRNSLYRARRAAATTVPFTVEQLQQRFAYYGDRCYLRLDGCTGGADHVEHVKPLSKGGAHMLCNLRPACASCNHRKRDKWPFTYGLEDSA